MLFICQSVRLAQVLNVKQSTQFTGILKKNIERCISLQRHVGSVLHSVVCLCVLIIWVTAGQMPAVVTADKEWGFFYMCMFVVNYRLLSLPFRSSSL